MKSALIYLSVFLFSLSSVQDESAYAIGDQVSNFTLPGVNGRDVSLKDYAGEKGVILIFSCNECPYVHKYEDRMIKLHETYAPQGWPVLAISSNDPDRMRKNGFRFMRKRAKELGFPFEYVQDRDQAQMRKFGARKTPEVFLLSNEGGEFTIEYNGAIDDSPKAAGVEQKYVEDALASLMAGEPVALKETKAIGCTIRSLKKAK